MERFWKRNTFGLPIAFVFFLFALLGPWVAPYSPRAMDLWHAYELPSRAHWLGTADNGVDILSVLFYGARLGATIGVPVVLLSLAMGTLLGFIAGYQKGWFEHVVMGTADLVQAFPSTMLNIAILALVAEPGVTHVIVALVCNGWVTYARLARVQTRTLQELEFVHAARALGVPTWRVVLLHILPNAYGPLLVQASSGFGGAILTESTLSFLGLGPGTETSWGALLDQGTGVLLRFPHVSLFAGIALAITVLGFQLTGDWMRDRLDLKRE